MTGSSLVPIITPIVAIITLACWLGFVYWADAHPDWKNPGAPPGPELTGGGSHAAAAEPGDHDHGELGPTPPDKRAA
jgi:hypothetical protein